LGVIGLGFGLLTELLVNQGPDNFAQIFPFLGFVLAMAAFLAEGGVVPLRFIRGKRLVCPRGED
jgi:hypothetical protein